MQTVFSGTVGTGLQKVGADNVTCDLSRSLKAGIFSCLQLLSPVIDMDAVIGPSPACTTNSTRGSVSWY